MGVDAIPNSWEKSVPGFWEKRCPKKFLAKKKVYEKYFFSKSTKKFSSKIGGIDRSPTLLSGPKFL